jgi:hypothetical protein
VQGANGGNHRFNIALPNQLLRTFQQKKLYAHGIALAGNVDNALLAGSGNFTLPSPKWSPDPPTPDFPEGPRVAAFDTQKEFCEQIDIPMLRRGPSGITKRSSYCVALRHSCGLGTHARDHETQLRDSLQIAA